MEGKINARKVPDFQKEIEDILAANPGQDFLFDAKDLIYISSAGLRLLLSLQKKLGKGKTVVTVLPDTAERYFSTPLFEND